MSANNQDTPSDNASGDTNSHQNESQPESGRITLGNPQKPVMKMNNVLSTADMLRSRLNSFMPQLARSNEGLSAEQNMEATDCPEDRQHIALELACGVLEERAAQPADATSRPDVTIPLPSMRNGNSESTATNFPAMMLPTPSATGSSGSSDEMSEDEDEDEDEDDDDDDDDDDDEDEDDEDDDDEDSE